MSVHMLRSVGEDKALKCDVIRARCGYVRPHRRSDAFPTDFTVWEEDVRCSDCRLMEASTP